MTCALVAANVLAYGLEKDAIAAGGDPCTAYGLVPAQWVETREFAPMLTSLFLHDPNALLHIAGNMLFLAIFGALVERAVGPLRFALLYVAAGIGGALVHVLVDPFALVPMVGASGAIFGVLAAAAMLRRRSVVFVAVYFLSNLGYAFMGGAGGIAFGAHIGGFVAGFLVMRVVFASTLAEEAA